MKISILSDFEAAPLGMQSLAVLSELVLISVMQAYERFEEFSEVGDHTNSVAMTGAVGVLDAVIELFEERNGVFLLTPAAFERVKSALEEESGIPVATVRALEA